MNLKTKIAGISLGTVALAAGVGVGVSYADPSPSASPSTSPSSSAPSTTPKAQQHKDGKKDGQHAKRALLKRALHGEVTVGGKEKTRVISFQRGTVSAVSGSSITVKSVDGFSGTYKIDAQTKVRKAGDAAKIADVKNGDKVRVMAQKSGSTATAKVVAEPKTK